MGMTLKEMLRKGASDGTVNADEVRALAQECGLDTESLYTILEERGIKIQENEAALDVDSILAEVESAENSANETDYDEPEDDHIEERKALYTAEGKKYYSGNLFVPDDEEIIDL